MISVSVIMPVFNAGSKLEKAIESVLFQTLKGFELILIDDGSTDGSGDVCTKYGENDQRIIVIRQKNCGLCMARNRGLSIAQGEYIAFIDHDDLYLPMLLEENYRLAKYHNADVVKFNYNVLTSDRKNRVRINLRNQYVIEEKNLYEYYAILKGNDVLTLIWDGLYKKDFLNENDLHFDPRFKVGEEDRNFCIRFYPHIKKFVYNPNICYIHYVYGDSTSNTSEKTSMLRHVADVLYNLKLERKILNNSDIDIISPSYWKERQLEASIMCVGNFRSIKNLKNRELKEFISQLRNELILGADWLGTVFRLLNLKQKFWVPLFYYQKMNLLLMAFFCFDIFRWMKNNVFHFKK